MICSAVRYVAIVGSALAAAACGASQSGPCSVMLDEALISIVRAEDASTHAPMARVGLRSIFVDDQPITDPGILTRVSAPVKGVTVVGNELVCDIVCSFAMQEGLYRMTVYAEDYRDTTIAVLAKYANHQSGPGGCPVRASGGVKLSIALARQ